MILSTLKVFNFPDKYIAWIETLPLNFSVTLVNGYLSLKILLKRGCGQGDPVADYLFIFAIEVLMLRINNCKNIYPWKSRKNNIHLQEGYADDLSIFLRRLEGSNKKQTNAIPKIPKSFEDISSLLVNISKTQICPFEPPKNPNDSEDRNFDKEALKETGFEIINNLKLLGIKFTPSLKNICHNYTQYLSNIRKVLHTWTRLGLSKMEKVHAIKTYVLSKFNHIVAILPNPPVKVLDNIKTAIARFIN